MHHPPAATMTRLAGVVCAGLVIISNTLGAVQSPSTSTVVAAASRYAEDYRKQFSAVVCEETQTQTLVKPDGRISRKRVLVSDLTFVKTEDTWILHSFRDVISVDGKAVRNRDDRLKKLFLDGKKNAVQLAQAIGQESGRYNLGMSRVGNSPLLPISLLDPHIIENFSFGFASPTLTFEEKKSPTFMSFRRNGKRGDMPATGSMVIDPVTGVIQSATISAESPGAPLATKFTVTYAEEPTLKMRVPTTMTEHYHYPDKPKEDHLEATATYSSFRKFSVSTTEVIKR
jgi:hypothetical protein